MNIIMAAILATPFLAGGGTPDKEAKKVVKEFRSIYFLKTTSDEDRVVAIQRLAKTPHLITARMLGKLLFIAPDTHRIEAAVALRSFSKVRGASPLVAKALMSRSNRKNTPLRVALVWTLGSLRQITVLPLLHQLVEKDDFVVAKAVIEVIPSFERRESIPVLIKYLRKCERKPDNIKLKLNLGDLRNKHDEPGVDPSEDQKDFNVKITADEKQRLRHTLCYPTLKMALRTMTGLQFQDWKSWNNWWRKGGVCDKSNR